MNCLARRFPGFQAPKRLVAEVSSPRTCTASPSRATATTGDRGAWLGTRCLAGRPGLEQTPPSLAIDEESDPPRARYRLARRARGVGPGGR